MSTPLTRDALLSSYASYGTPRARWRVGGEYERAVVRPDGGPVRWDDPDGIRWIMESLGHTLGWKEKREDDQPIELLGRDASITLEPGGQIELSGAPYDTLDALHQELLANRAALYSVTRGKPLHWIAAGLTPYARIDDIPYVPKGRYRVMRDYLPRRGDLAAWMMKGTCSVQANFDYADEADCARKFHVALALGPLTTALFANSPLAEGRPTGWMSYRGHVWTRTDPARTGFPASVRDGYTHARWVDYLLDTPMMFIRPGGRWRTADGVTFRQWMERGIDGIHPDDEDWALHQTSVFPEVRVKRTIEIRGADAVSVPLAMSFLALWKGLLYGALDEAVELADAFAAGPETPEARHAAGARLAMRAELGGRSVAEWGRAATAIARRGLRAVDEADGWLDPLDARLADARAPAVDVLDAWERDPSPANVLGVLAY